MEWVKTKTEKDFRLIKEFGEMVTENLFHVCRSTADMLEIETRNGIRLGFWYKRRFVPHYPSNWEV